MWSRIMRMTIDYTGGRAFVRAVVQSGWVTFYYMNFQPIETATKQEATY